MPAARKGNVLHMLLGRGMFYICCPEGQKDIRKRMFCICCLEGNVFARAARKGQVYVIEDIKE